MSTSKPNKYVMRTIIILSKTNANNKEKKRKFILCLLYLLSKVEKHSFLSVECVNAEKRKKEQIGRYTIVFAILHVFVFYTAFILDRYS